MIQSFIIKIGLTFLIAITGSSIIEEQTKQNTPVEEQEVISQWHTQLNELTSQMPQDTVQVFDIKKGHVIKSVENNGKIQKQTKRLLDGIYEFAPEIQPDMSAKYIIRIPVKEGTKIKVNQTELAIKELFIFYYVDKEPLVLVFDTNKRPYLFHTKQSLDPLLKLIQVE